MTDDTAALIKEARAFLNGDGLGFGIIDRLTSRLEALSQAPAPVVTDEASERLRQAVRRSGRQPPNIDTCRIWLEAALTPEEIK